MKFNILNACTDKIRIDKYREEFRFVPVTIDTDKKTIISEYPYNQNELEYLLFPNKCHDIDVFFW